MANLNDQPFKQFANEFRTALWCRLNDRLGYFVAADPWVLLESQLHEQLARNTGLPIYQQIREQLGSVPWKQ